MPAQKLKEFLESKGIRYESIAHTKAYTAMETAQSANISGKVLAKTVIIRAGGKLAMAVLPANHRLDLDSLSRVTGSPDVEITSEREFRDLFPDCEVGAMPPFGNLYGMEVFVEQSLAEDEEIAFNAGTHTELIKIAYKDFERVVHPRVLMFAS